MELSKTNPTLQVDAVAINQNDKIYTLPPPARHPDLMKYMVMELQCQMPVRGEQGFVLSDSSFATRERAAEVALTAGQCVMPLFYHGKELHSEDLWVDL